MNRLKTASTITSALTILAALPYEMETLGNILPPKVKETVVASGLIATVILRLFAAAKPK